MKFGLDFHGVINKKPELFAALSKALVDAGHQVHVITGPKRDVVESQLKEFGVVYTHFFSITEYEELRGTEITWNEGDPYMDQVTWNKAKAEYCNREGIDLHIDDQSEYGEHFTTPFSLFKHNESK